MILCFMLSAYNMAGLSQGVAGSTNWLLMDGELYCLLWPLATRFMKPATLYVTGKHYCLLWPKAKKMLEIIYLGMQILAASICASQKIKIKWQENCQNNYIITKYYM